MIPSHLVEAAMNHTREVHDNPDALLILVHFKITLIQLLESEAAQ